jgi:hypothetical protein
MISESARKFGEQLQDIVVSKNRLPTGDRNVLQQGSL